MLHEDYSSKLLRPYTLQCYPPRGTQQTPWYRLQIFCWLPLWNPKVHHHCHKILSMSHFRPDHIFTSYFFQMQFNFYHMDLPLKARGMGWRSCLKYCQTLCMWQFYIGSPVLCFVISLDGHGIFNTISARAPYKWVKFNPMTYLTAVGSLPNHGALTTFIALKSLDTGCKSLLTG